MKLFGKRKKIKKNYGNKNAKTISVSTQKGGVGKTTFSTNYAVYCAMQGYKVLLIDLDSQAHTAETLFYHFNETESLLSEYLLDSEKDPMNLISVSKIENLHYIPADKNLNKTEKILSSEIGKEFSIKKLLDVPKTHYDFIIIDTAPNFGNLTLASLVASNFVIVPTELSSLSIEGINDLVLNLVTVAENYNPDIDILGIIINKIDYRTKKTNTPLLKELNERFSDYLISPYLPLSSLFKKSQYEGKSIFHYAPKHKVTAIFKELSDNLLKRI